MLRKATGNSSLGDCNVILALTQGASSIGQCTSSCDRLLAPLWHTITGETELLQLTTATSRSEAQHFSIAIIGEAARATWRPLDDRALTAIGIKTAAAALTCIAE